MKVELRVSIQYELSGETLGNLQMFPPDICPRPTIIGPPPVGDTGPSTIKRAHNINKVFWTKKTPVFWSQKASLQAKMFSIFSSCSLSKYLRASIFIIIMVHLDGMMLDLFLSRLVLLPNKSLQLRWPMFLLFEQAASKEAKPSCKSRGGRHRNTTCPTTLEHI